MYPDAVFRVQSSTVRYKTFHSSFAEQNLSSVLQPKRWGMDRAPSMFLWTIKILHGLCFICGSTWPRTQLCTASPCFSCSALSYYASGFGASVSRRTCRMNGLRRERKPEQSASPPEAGGGGCESRLRFPITSPSVPHSAQMTQLADALSSVWLPLIENSFQAQASGCLSVLVCEVRHLNLSCLYTVRFSRGLGEAWSRPSRQRPFLNQRLCSPNCQLCYAAAFIQPKNLDVKILQE